MRRMLFALAIGLMVAPGVGYSADDWEDDSEGWPGEEDTESGGDDWGDDSDDDAWGESSDDGFGDVTLPLSLVCLLYTSPSPRDNR